MDTVLSEVVNKSDSEIVLFMIVACVILVVAITPLYKKVQEARLARQRAAQEREQQVIDIISKNTDVISKFTTSWELTHSATKDSLNRVHERLDTVISGVDEIRRRG